MFLSHYENLEQYFVELVFGGKGKLLEESFVVRTGRQGAYKLRGKACVSRCGNTIRLSLVVVVQVMV